MTNPVPLPDLAAALDALILAETKIELGPDDITKSRLMSKTGWNHHRAQKVIGEWAKAGRLEYIGKRRSPGNGCMVDAWRLVERT